MKNFALEIISQTASFRNPDFQNFHKSLDLPPPTTIVGLSGAALGLSPLEAQEFFESNGLKLGVYGLFQGKCSDTWKYNKRTTDLWKHRSWSKYSHLFTKKEDMDGSIIQKEYLVNTKFIIAFSGENSDSVEKLVNAFLNPKYALTMGNSDSLAFIKNIQIDLPKFSSYTIENCMINGDVIDSVMSLTSENLEFSIYNTSNPLAYELPIKFNYANDYGNRIVSEIATFSIIGRKMKLNYEIDGLNYKDLFIPMLKL
jgi:CRISPR-associated protein Cas5t